jgi:hypothetical protein
MVAAPAADPDNGREDSDTVNFQLARKTRHCPEFRPSWALLPVQGACGKQASGLHTDNLKNVM